MVSRPHPAGRSARLDLQLCVKEMQRPQIGLQPVLRPQEGWAFTREDVIFERNVLLHEHTGQKDGLFELDIEVVTAMDQQNGRVPMGDIGDRGGAPFAVLFSPFSSEERPE